MTTLPALVGHQLALGSQKDELGVSSTIWSNAWNGVFAGSKYIPSLSCSSRFYRLLHSEYQALIVTTAPDFERAWRRDKLNDTCVEIRSNYPHQKNGLFKSQNDLQPESTIQGVA